MLRSWVLIILCCSLASVVQGQEILGWGSLTYQNGGMHFDEPVTGDFEIGNELLMIGLFTRDEGIGEGDLGAVFVSDPDTEPDWDAFIATMTDADSTWSDYCFYVPAWGGGGGWGMAEATFYTFAEGVGPVDFYGTDITEITATVTELVWDWDEYTGTLDYLVTLQIEVWGEILPTAPASRTWGEIKTLYR